MRLWYVIDNKEYWLSPDYGTTKTGKVTLHGARLYDATMKYKGYWQVSQMPLEVHREIRKKCTEAVKRHRQAERDELRQLQYLHRDDE